MHRLRGAALVPVPHQVHVLILLSIPWRNKGRFLALALLPFTVFLISFSGSADNSANQLVSSFNFIFSTLKQYQKKSF